MSSQEHKLSTETMKEGGREATRQDYNNHHNQNLELKVSIKL